MINLQTNKEGANLHNTHMQKTLIVLFIFYFSETTVKLYILPAILITRKHYYGDILIIMLSYCYTNVRKDNRVC
jgi:hypothetical protein